MLPISSFCKFYEIHVSKFSTPSMRIPQHMIHACSRKLSHHFPKTFIKINITRSIIHGLNLIIYHTWIEHTHTLQFSAALNRQNFICFYCQLFLYNLHRPTISTALQPITWCRLVIFKRCY